MTVVLLYISSVSGTVLSVLVTLSPFPSLYRAWNSKKLDEISYLFILLSNLNTQMWIIYSIKQDDIVILIPNMVNFFTTLSLLL